MNVKTLSKMMENSFLKSDPEKQRIYYEYCVGIKEMLSPFPEDAPLGKISSLTKEEYKDLTMFDNFVRGRSTESIIASLSVLQAELKNWAKNYVANNNNEVHDLLCHSNRKHKVMTLFIITIGVTVLAATILTILDIVGKIGFGKELSSAISCVDFALGGIFFCYEHYSDTKKDKIHADAKACTDNAQEYQNYYSINSNNRIWGNGNIIGDGNVINK